MKKIFTFLLLLLLGLGKITQVHAQAANVQDSLALVALYDSTGGPNWYNNSGWLKGPVSSWYGISLGANGRVDSIELADNDLKGIIPSSIGNLVYLVFLDLGGIGADLKSPPFGYNANGDTYPDIKVMYELSGGPRESLSGTIPSAIGNLTRLKYLNLGGNGLNGNIPPSVGNLVNLTFLNLGVNGFSGEIPSSFGNLVNLKELYLEDNDCSGDLPSSLGNLDSLKVLVMPRNHFSGNVPSSLGNISGLYYLNMNGNELTGNIPSSFGNFSNLALLSLYNNQLTGAIPSSLGNLNNVQIIDVHSNSLSGNIPSSLGNLSNLIALEVDNNELTGSIPSTFGNLKNLSILFVNGNQLSGEISSSLGLSGLSHNTGSNSFISAYEDSLAASEGISDTQAMAATIHPSSIQIDDNKYTFNGMEDFAQTFVGGRYYGDHYSPQDTILPINNNQGSLSLSAGGTLSNNSYKWINLNTQLDTLIVGDSTFIPIIPGLYCVQATNSIASQLTLFSDTINVSSVRNIPFSKFILSTDTVQLNDTITTTNHSLGNIVAYLWSASPVNGVNFSPGGTVAQPNIAFADTGTYVISLIVGNVNGTDTSSETVEVVSTPVIASPVANFTISQNTVAVGGSISTSNTSSGNPTSYAWSAVPSAGVSFSPDSSATNPSISFSNEGSYTIYLTATNANGSNTTNESITVEAQPTYSISGTVNNPTVSDEFGDIKGNPLTCEVKIYNTGTTTVVASTTANGGQFSFSGLKNKKYDVYAAYTSNGTTYSVKDNGVLAGTSGVLLQIPVGVIEDIKSYNDTLSNLQAYLDDLGASVQVGAYDITPSSEFISGEQNITSNQDQVIEALERLCLAERLLDKYYKQAASLNNQYVTSVSSLGGFVFGMLSPDDNESESWIESLLNSAIDDLKSDVLDALKNAIEVPIDNINSPYTTYYNDAIEMVFDQLEGGITPGDVYDITFKPSIDKLLTTQNLNNIYIPNTAGQVVNSVNNAQNGNFTGNIKNTISNLASELGASEVSTSVALAYAQSYDQQPQWVQVLTQLNGYAEDIPGVKKYADILGAGLSAIHIGFIVASIYQSVNREGQLVNEANQNIPNSFLRKRPVQWNLFNARIQASQLASLDSLVQNFEGQYEITLANINQNDTSNLYQNLTNLVQLNGQIGDSVLNIINGIKAAIPNSGIAYNTYLNDLQNALFGSPFVRFAQLTSLVEYARTFNDTLRDSITYHFPDMRYSDSAMLAELGTMAGTLSNVSTPAYISVSKSGIPLNMPRNTDSTVTVRFKNYGSTAASGVYAKIQIDTPFTGSIDSVYIGNLDVEQQDSLTFTLHAPIADTFSHYTIRFFAASAITNPLGGTIFSRTPTLYNLSSSNFKVSASAASCVGSSDGAINVIADSSLHYTATLSDNTIDSTYSFTDTLAINNLAAGTYELCLSVNGEPGYQQRYTLTIAQPKPLSAYAVVNPSQHIITLNMDGGRIYYIQLGHQFYTTSNNEITLPLTSNEHLLMISTDKACQGIVRKQINIPGEVMSYPNPFNDYLNIDFGKDNVANAIIKITELSTGRVVYDEHVENQSGTMQLNTSDFNAGIYALDIYFNHVKYAFKIVKVEK